MSVFSHAESGLPQIVRKRFPINTVKQLDTRFGEMIPIFMDFCMPADVWRLQMDLFIRLQPMLSPTLTRMFARIRFFFVPIRLVEPTFEELLTNAKNGHQLSTPAAPLDNIFARLASGVAANVQKWSFMDYAFKAQVGDYSAFKTDEFLPAAYFYKAFKRCEFDYYRDQNLDSEDDFDAWIDTDLKQNYAGLADKLPFVRIHKDYFSSALPWQLKGVAPTFSINPVANFANSVLGTTSTSPAVNLQLSRTEEKLSTSSSDTDVPDEIISALNKVQISGGNFNMSDLRTMAAQTRIFERLARTGSRYTEFLRANFGVSPSDGTLQRAQYLGGFTQPIVTTEVVQTAADGANPVGTLRGHGISAAKGSIKPYLCKEFGVLVGIFDIIPEIVRTTGINRKYSYKRRFDFPNPSFQHLSEQEVRNGEVFVGSDGKNDETFGFQAMYNELRTGDTMICGDMRDSLKYWNQGISFATRPNLNASFINSKEYLSNFNQPFTVVSNSARPVIVDSIARCDVARTLSRYGTPGLNDHL